MGCSFPTLLYITIILLGFISASVLGGPEPQRQYYNGPSYQYPLQTGYPQYQLNANGYYYPAPRRPSYQVPQQSKKERSYKDICRLVNTNGFTNPGGVPKCPY
ncbi:uncharacterized protein LOC142242474 [Haematobia irritans]|uniref:uncharacterized protein LOC142242474 n=1 Tax=Haematobia irritans TaxID=7368 RepID=UPI003F509169